MARDPEERTCVSESPYAFCRRSSRGREKRGFLRVVCLANPAIPVEYCRASLGEVR